MSHSLPYAFMLIVRTRDQESFVLVLIVFNDWFVLARCHIVFVDNQFLHLRVVSR